ncbi:hypothetical protein QBC40DRAFT_308773 [Triangularia verruculosa]|uniref:VWFA domain-containing protein n=1 Tax=Triangularia verruculosa TaxID=2587418 RepID=A0AAN6XCW9_9PEZI|nr:hypothetical protein QBC40DRAFT_308773 [Triangularia verruculosa]
MAKDCYLTLTVRNLPPGTTKQDVCNHINARFQNARPEVGPVVKDPNGQTFCTTVTVRQDTEDKCKILLRDLNLRKIFPLYPTTDMRESELNVSDEFIGVTTLAEHDNPLFDLYFVHGLGGHAFKSWSTSADTASPRIWLRDLFPDDIKARPVNRDNPNGPKLAGRFSTIGYRASSVGSNSAIMTIEKAAENLLNMLRTDRPEGSSRPVYFACHSLGGIVTCQAMIHALRHRSDENGGYHRHRDTLYQNDECLVKGIFFFGTPFEGSKLADNASLMLKFLNKNSPLLDSLKAKSNELADIVARFNQLRSHPHTNIPILIAYEGLPIYGKTYVTKPDSASSSFKAHTMEINGDHRTMVKFSKSDVSYREVAEEMIRLIQNTLTVSNMPPPVSPKTRLQDAFQPKLPSRSSTFSSIRTMPPPYPGFALPFSQHRKLQPGEPSPPASERASPVSDTRSLTMLAETQSYDDPAPAIPVAYDDNPLTIPLVRHINLSTPVVPVKYSDIIPALKPGKRELKSPFSQLGQFDTVFLLDDTGSMGETEGDDKPRSKWDDLIESLQWTADLVCRYNKNGIDVHFFIDEAKDEFGIRKAQRLLDLLSNEVAPDELGGGTYIADRLYTILTEHLVKFEKWKQGLTRGRGPSRVEKPKKLNLIVITDGAADDMEEVEDVIVETAKKLDELQAPVHQLGIQFLQIGKDDDAARWLAKLDDALKEKHNIRDIVDTRPWNRPTENDKSLKDRLKQILLGAISRAIDDERAC